MSNVTSSLNIPLLFKKSDIKTRIGLILGLGLVVSVMINPAQAAGTDEATLDVFKMVMTLAGGLAVFLFGMEQMGEALKIVAGDRMKVILAKLTTNRFTGMLTGAFVTAIIQSSSVTTVMLVGFVTANLMSLSQSVGVIFGANIGTTITAQIIAFKVTKYSLLLVAVGFGMLFMGRKDKMKHYGALIMGLGLVFFGLSIMSNGMKPLRAYEPFIDLMQNVSNPLIGIAVAMTFTALVQSSSATTGVVLAMAIQGLVSLEGGIALLFGANVGTCVTAGLAAIGKPREAVRVAVAHTAFNISGVLLVVWFIPWFADLVRWASPDYSHLEGMERLAAETPRQIANAHTIFNISMALLFLPAAPMFARFCEWVVPDKPLTETETAAARVQTKYLDPELLETPVLALDRVGMEIERIGHRVRSMFFAALPATLQGSLADLKKVEKMDEEVDSLHAQTISYLQAIGMDNLSKEQGHHFYAMMEAVNYFENIGDLIETDLVSIGMDRVDHNMKFSKASINRLSKLHSQIGTALDETLEAIISTDADAANRVIAMKGSIDATVSEVTLNGIESLIASTNAADRALYNREREMIERFKRIYYFLKRIAKLFATIEEDEVTKPAKGETAATA
ncbi:MAG: Na/Pi cotransporter family protein [Rhodospirillales bacterium]|nr:Na/Pi cotransporter family protein [Rhodospirillales bacterium]